MAEGKPRLPYVSELLAITGPKRLESEETELQKAVGKISPSKTLKREGREVAQSIYDVAKLRRGKGRKNKKSRKVKRRRS